jgi:hypothetical protein
LFGEGWLPGGNLGDSQFMILAAWRGPVIQ